MTEPRYLQARKLIQRLGGMKEACRILSRNRNTIARWLKPAELGGCDGELPRASMDELIANARMHGVLITERDFLRHPNPRHGKTPPTPPALTITRYEE